MLSSNKITISKYQLLAKCGYQWRQKIKILYFLPLQGWNCLRFYRQFELTFNYCFWINIAQNYFFLFFWSLVYLLCLDDLQMPWTTEDWAQRWAEVCVSSFPEGSRQSSHSLLTFCSATMTRKAWCIFNDVLNNLTDDAEADLMCLP